MPVADIDLVAMMIMPWDRWENNGLLYTKEW